MPRVKFHTVVAFDSKTAWGYPVEVTPEGVFGDVPDELIDVEVAAGRVSLLEPKRSIPVETKDVVFENLTIEERVIQLDKEGFTETENLYEPEISAAEKVAENPKKRKYTKRTVEGKTNGE